MTLQRILARANSHSKTKTREVQNPSLLPWPSPLTPHHTTQLHAQMLVTGALRSPAAITHLLNSLSDPATGDLRRALHLFDQIPHPTTIIWNTIIRACNRSQSPKQAIHLYHRMRHTGPPPDSFTFTVLFKSCALLDAVPEGLAAHGAFVKGFCNSDTAATNSLINMYAKFGRISAARQAFGETDTKDVISWTSMIGGLVNHGLLDEALVLFDEMPERNVVSWTSIIVGYSRAGRARESVEVFEKMLTNNITPDGVVVVAVLSACAQLRDLELGKWLYRYVEKEGIGISRNLAVSLIDMYAKCGDMASAHQAFESMGRKITPAWNAIIDGYCKAGDIDMARSLFDQMDARDGISFNSMITGYIQSCQLREALLLFAEFRGSGLQPDKFTVVGLLTACASLGALGQGKALHAYIEQSAIKPDIFLGTALVDMYAKCGKMDQAILVFNKMNERDVLTWTALISGLAMNGTGKLALEYFSLMQKEGVEPNVVAYIGVLSACSHSGLLDEGRKCFEEMKNSHNIQPEIEHYGCMVDLLGRCGHLKEAMGLIQSMPMEPNAVIWGSLLSSCRVYKEVDLAEWAAKHLFVLEPYLDAPYVQLYNIYMDIGRQSEALKVRRRMEEMGIKKTTGYSSIVVSGQLHKFISGDQSHPDNREIQEMMREMMKKLRLAGYLPTTAQVSVDVDDEEKEDALFVHSERMAIAYGLMRLGSNLPIHVIKNLRVCEDCHSVIKLISKIWSRSIVVRDRSRFHHFWDGTCSCSDFW